MVSKPSMDNVDGRLPKEFKYVEIWYTAEEVTFEAGEGVPKGVE